MEGLNILRYITALSEKVLLGEIDLEYIKTKHQIADLFKKGFSVNKLESFCKQLAWLSRRTDARKGVKVDNITHILI